MGTERIVLNPTKRLVLGEEYTVSSELVEMNEFMRTVYPNIGFDSLTIASQIMNGMHALCDPITDMTEEHMEHKQPIGFLRGQEVMSWFLGQAAGGGEIKRLFQNPNVDAMIRPGDQLTVDVVNQIRNYVPDIDVRFNFKPEVMAADIDAHAIDTLLAQGFEQIDSSTLKRDATTIYIKHATLPVAQKTLHKMYIYQNGSPEFCIDLGSQAPYSGRHMLDFRFGAQRPNQDTVLTMDLFNENNKLYAGIDLHI